PSSAVGTMIVTAPSGAMRSQALMSSGSRGGWPLADATGILKPSTRPAPTAALVCSQRRRSIVSSGIAASLHSRGGALDGPLDARVGATAAHVRHRAGDVGTAGVLVLLQQR